jgi:hypothetical protein
MIDHDRKKTNYLTFEIGFDYFLLRLYIEPPNQLIDRLPAIDCLGFIRHKPNFKWKQ